MKFQYSIRTLILATIFLAVLLTVAIPGWNYAPYWEPDPMPDLLRWEKQMDPEDFRYMLHTRYKDRVKPHWPERWRRDLRPRDFSD